MAGKNNRNRFKPNQLGTASRKVSIKKKKRKKSAVTCRNCIHYQSGICDILTQKMEYAYFINDHTNARRCQHYINKYQEKVK